MSTNMPPSLPYALNSAATTNANLIQAGTTRLNGFNINNASAASKFVRFYNKATAPVPGTDTPVMVVTVPASSTFNAEPTEGYVFPLGLGIAITGAAPVLDSTAVAAGDVQVLAAYTPNVS